ncbi:hypothetical protein EDD52_1493 [Primorskyibacter sedentarius]|uniref:Uncharacterized protein n=1 Tax=Primorskyibacter sedentarius TaxID=745311 RepID=A0A4R3IKW8_9RHOB|nr:hypothetical protein [Primorskyibacter sedentarius]TCS49749.1 hypothetical protein EDD52_1493 [Primorskyibacter sedentarius]
MAQTAYAFDRNFQTSGEVTHPKTRFLTRCEIEADQTLDGVISAEQYRRYNDDVVRDVIGIDLAKGVVRRASPPTDLQVRTAPSSTGKIVEWEGVVETIAEDHFSCKMKVVKGSQVDFDEFSEFSIDRVDPGDRDLIQPGALFRLVIGVQAISGTRQQYSRLIFRRLPAWRQEAMIKARSHLDSVMNDIAWADEKTPAT